MKVWMILVFFTVHVTLNGSEEVGCRGENGNLVDWFYLYKIPSSVSFNGTRSDENDPDKGLNYLFITSESTAHEWSLSNKLMNDSKSAPGHTLNQSVFGDNKNNLIILYNDQPPEGTGISTRGHSKGVVITDGNKGFWLVHSVPHFPPAFENRAEYNYPNTGKMYGQSFLCISLNAQQMNKVGRQLKFNEVEVYSSQVPVVLK